MIERILLVFMSNLILICGILRGVEGMSFSLKFLRFLLFLMNLCLFCKILILMLVCLLVVVENIFDFDVGSVVFWGISFVIIFFNVLRLRDNGVILSRMMFEILLVSILVCIVVLSVMILLGFMFMFGFFLVRFLINSRIVGMRVEFLIRIILLIFVRFNFVFFSVCWIGIL